GLLHRLRRDPVRLEEEGADDDDHEDRDGPEPEGLLPPLLLWRGGGSGRGVAGALSAALLALLLAGFGRGQGDIGNAWRVSRDACGATSTSLTRHPARITSTEDAPALVPAASAGPAWGARFAGEVLDPVEAGLVPLPALLRVVVVGVGRGAGAGEA